MYIKEDRAEVTFGIKVFWGTKSIPMHRKQIKHKFFVKKNDFSFYFCPKIAQKHQNKMPKKTTFSEKKSVIKQTLFTVATLKLQTKYI